ncbi:MerR family transcriptional regulator [Kamptonema cortianum]|nr:MerR family transcriptional regulator [Kamptonema cortianum]
MVYDAGQVFREALSMYTVKQISDLAGVSVRTLHYYDEIGLLHPSAVGENGYRYYDDDALMQLQQILFYREIGLELAHIRDLLHRPDFDVREALRTHRTVLEGKIRRYQSLIDTIDKTLNHLSGESTMSKKSLFEGFSQEQQDQYTREARLQYGPDIVNASLKRWNSYTKDQQTAIMEEASQIYTELAEAIEAERSPNSPEVQALLERWHENIRWFYEPTLEILRGLGMGYNSDPGFIATFTRYHADLPAFLEAAITTYVDELETAEIQRMLEENDDNRSQR